MGFNPVEGFRSQNLHVGCSDLKITRCRNKYPTQARKIANIYTSQVASYFLNFFLKAYLAWNLLKISIFITGLINVALFDVVT